MRISILPTLNGEKVVIRLLSQYVRSFSFNDLGLSQHDQELLMKAINKPFGMILVTGPTGSGKTTSLYALLKLLNSPDVNITTIEDPVEYKMPGINQIQVNSQTNLTFAKGLRSIVRQDPDIILVGEIRDQETAETAVNAALTGHLLLSTFHANDAATAVPRLLDMDIEPFLLSSTLEVLIAQRLVRKICDQCRFSTSLSKEEVKKTIPADVQKYFTGKHIVLYQGKGCASCGNTGFRGRTAIYEFIEVTPEIQELILQNPSTAQIWKIARKQGSVTLFEDGIEKVKNGITTLEELLRMAEPPKF
jgi:type II secretory ATPase GspE/PulE/Tfp pilus assembly ATPase PilB-like protein